MKRQEYIILIVLCALVFISGMHEKYIGSGIRADIYLFYDYYHINNKGVRIDGRFLSNIINDFSNLITTSSLLFILYLQAHTKNLKKIFLPFLIISMADIVDYCLFFGKLAHIKLGILTIMLLFFIYKLHKNRK